MPRGGRQIDETAEVRLESIIFTTHNFLRLSA